jgi:hypothetical protein
VDKTHKAIVNGLGHSSISPAALAYKMLKESKYVNESFLQYAINYIIIMATSKVIPAHLESVHNECKILYTSLTELGLTGTVGREEVNTSEYLQV